MFLWVVGLEVIKQVCCVSQVSAREQSQIRHTTCFLLETAPFSTGTQVLPQFTFANSVWSLTTEYSSVAGITIFTAWYLALVHVHT